MKKAYLVKDLNNPKITKVEYRTQCPKNAIGEAPKGEEACWLYKDKKDGRIKVDNKKKALVLHQREEAKKKVKKKSTKKTKKKSYGKVTQEDVMKAKSFDDLKRYIAYLLEINGVK